MDPSRRLVVGLGNPGPRYRDTRHNIGFLVVEELARRLGWTFRAGTGPWREAADPAGNGPFTLLEPQTYMNLSGEAVRGWALARGFEPCPVAAAPTPCPEHDPTRDPAPGAPAPAPDAEAPAPAPWRPLIVCDDLALPLGSLRLRARGSSGGQKGLASVIEVLGHEDLPRLRLGIAPADRPVAPADWPDFVLTPFAPAEAEAVADLVARAADAVQCWAERGVDEAASRHNRR